MHNAMHLTLPTGITYVGGLPNLNYVPINDLNQANRIVQEYILF